MTIRLAFVAEEESWPLQAEQQVLELLLKEWIERGIVEVSAVPSVTALLPGLAECAAAAEVDVVSIGCGDSEVLADVPWSYQVAELRLDEAIPRLRWRHQSEGANGLATEGEGGDPWLAWQQLTLRLFAEMV